MTATEPSWQPPSLSTVLTPALWAVRHHDHDSKAALNTLTCPPRCSAGGPVTPFEHNWVLFFETGGYTCGASLIDEQWAMTAAHCTENIDASRMQVRVHRHNKRGAGDHECAETLKIVEKFEHPDYSDTKSGNDIALLRLSQASAPSYALANRRRLPLDNLHLRSPPDPPSPRSR